MEDEIKRQESFKWDRDGAFSTYTQILGYFLAESVLENARKSKLLDLACGDGLLTTKFQGFFDRIVGVDASKYHIKKARERCPNIEFHVSLLENFETYEKFNTITMIDIIEHVVDPIEALKAASSHLAIDGILLVFAPNALGVNRRIAKIMGTLIDEYELSPFDINVAGHRRSYDRHLLIKEVESAGLKVINSGGVFYKMLSTPQIDFLLRKGLWEGGGHGWGRVGMEKSKDWCFEFCRACYIYGKEHPDETNNIYVCCTK